MSIYASKMPFPNRDPKPFIDREDGPGREIRQSWPDGWTDYEPRAEFDHVQHNEPNPILVEFRATCVDEADVEGWREAFSVARVDPGDWSLPTSIYDGTDEQFEHAYRVLERVSQLHGGAA